MCQDCGCLETSSFTLDEERVQSQNNHPHHHHSEQPSTKKIEVSLKQDILSKNNQIAEHNRQHLAQKGIFSINLISAPGSGKTSFLERLIIDKAFGRPLFVIEGDQQTQRDADRIKKKGVKAIQINTGAACHLDAEMIHKALHKLEPEQNSLVLIENVGNMVCPTAYDLGEDFKAAVISCPEGEDKPLKYPDLLIASKVLLINKIDLLPYLEFDLDLCMEYSRKINPEIKIFALSAKTGEGMRAFYTWLAEEMRRRFRPDRN